MLSFPGECSAGLVRRYEGHLRKQVEWMGGGALRVTLSPGPFASGGTEFHSFMICYTV